MGWRKAVLALVAAFVLVSALGVIEYLRIQGIASSVTQRLGRLQDAVTSPSLMLPTEGLSALRRDLEGAEGDIAALKTEAERFAPLAPAFLPGADELRAAPQVLGMGLDMVRATRHTLEGLEPLAGTLGRRRTTRVSLSTFDGEMASALEAGAPRFIQAQEDMARVRAARQSINPRELPPRSAAAVNDLDAAAPRLEASLKLALAGPALARTLLGLERPRSFLILAQNSQELRPTGGFLSGVWLVTVDRAKVTRLVFLNSSDVDDQLIQFPAPPRSLTITLWGGIWTFRDSNWAPDFLTAAGKMREFYHLGQGETVDGIIAVDEVGVRNLVEALGTIRIQYTGERVDASTIEQKLEYGMSSRFWSPPESPSLPPKKLLMKSLFESILFRVEQGLSFPEGGRMLRSVLQNLEEKRLLLAVDDEPLKSQVHAYQWDGAVVRAGGDHVLVTDTNVGFNKVNGAITQGLDYQVHISEDGKAVARLTITYTNTSRKLVSTCQQQATFVSDYKEWKEGCYWDLLRVYVPEGSKLLGTSFVPIPEGSMVARYGPDLASTWAIVGAVEWGAQEFSRFFVIPPGQTRSLWFEYALPDGTVRREGDQWRYTLLVQKQPGTSGIPLALTIVAPPSMIATVSLPYASPTTGNSVRVMVPLSIDRQFQVAIARR
ncbi:MAG: DUF4012 domain-containing protein [Chloroflexi bacterium]|nr:DUF4012 domain-containing protein [Chloroflexota bacterium]